MSGGRTAVVDTGPVIHLAEAGSLSLLEQFGTVLVPETVFEELQAGGVPTAFDALECQRRRVEHDEGRWPELDSGETAALALADRVGALLLTDDMAARQQATDLGVDVHGSIGVVLAAYADGRLDADGARARIRRLERDSTLYLSAPLVRRAIDRIDSEEDAESSG